VALKQAPWEVRQIYESVFRENARDFIEVLQYCKLHEISHERLWRVYQQLQVKYPSDISVDKFKALLGNNPQEVVINYPDTEITRYALELLTEVGDILYKN
jgi:pyruvate-formate lyase-activating enzyme